MKKQFAVIGLIAIIFAGLSCNSTNKNKAAAIVSIMETKTDTTKLTELVKSDIALLGMYSVSVYSGMQQVNKTGQSLDGTGITSVTIDIEEEISNIKSIIASHPIHAGSLLDQIIIKGDALVAQLKDY